MSANTNRGGAFCVPPNRPRQTDCAVDSASDGERNPGLTARPGGVYRGLFELQATEFSRISAAE